MEFRGLIVNSLPKKLPNSIKMDLLWKKDSSGLHVDLFSKKDLGQLFQAQLMIAVAFNSKKNKTSTELRQMGNTKMVAKEWCGAMMFYNRSLRFAEVDTENVSLAYANRSLCFLKMEMYDKCLIDIELAIRANYPQRLMMKLEERRAFCLRQLLSKGKSTEFTPKLDFEVDENFPGMANVLRMQCDEKFGRHFIAKCDVDAGKVVMLEEAFVPSIVLQPGYSICDSCFKTVTNFIACPQCSNALFCNETCADNSVHLFRCGRSSQNDDALVEYTLISLGIALNILDGVEELMDFVAGVVAEKTKTREIPISIVEPKDRYRMFLKLNLWLSAAEKTSLIETGKRAFETIQIKFEPVFDTPAKKRFVMHLCVMHASIILCNSFQDEMTGGIFLLKNHFNHSCVPNVFSMIIENRSYSTTIRRIKKGEQLFISYKPDFLFEPRQERQKHLYKGFGFKCECERCRNDNFSIPSQFVRSDPDVKRLTKDMSEFPVNKLPLVNGHEDSAKRATLKQKCIDIFIKLADLPWCAEFDMVYDWLRQLNDRVVF